MNQGDPWSMTFAWIWYMDSKDEYIPRRIDEFRVLRGLPSVFA